MNYQHPELLDRLAAEYVLGTLRGGARRRFEQILQRQPSARLAVQTWEELLAPLTSAVPPVAPSAGVWQRIEARTAPPRAVAAKRSAWASWWRPALGFAFGVLATIGIVQFAPERFMSLDGLAQREQALPQSYVGLLVDKEGLQTLLVSSTRHGTRVTVKSLRPVAMPPGKVLQLWALPRDAAPFPLGTIEPATPPGSTHFDMIGTSEKLLANVPRLAVSVEDAPGKPGRAPGEFILSGFCVKLW